MNKNMLICLFLLTTSLMFAQAPTSAWINEFHYDNDGADTLEFVEVVVDSAFNDLDNFTLSLYDGGDSAFYDSHSLSTFDTGSTQNGLTIYYKFIPMQNGSSGKPDGLTIGYNGTLIPGQFLSYEGTFQGKGGPADGITSTDVGETEGSSTPIGSSIGLIGTGTEYSDFTWTTFTSATPGMPNTNQALPVELTSFTAKIFDNNVELSWQTATEVNNYGFEIQRKTKYSSWEKIGFVKGHGNSNSPHNYFFTDENLNPGVYSYRLKQIDIDGKSEYSKTLTIKLKNNLTFDLKQNYPNPFNPVTKITYTIPKTSFVSLKVFNVLGEEVADLVEEKKLPGKYSVKLSSDDYDLTSGIYFYSLHYKNVAETKKMIILR